MKRLLSLFAVAAALLAPLAQAQQQPDDVAKSVAVAERWLALSDASDAGPSWDQAASSFQAAIPKANWAQALKQARQPFGAVKSRKLLSSAFKDALPGAPKGDYVVIQYDTSFENREHAVETVVPMREPDGSWKVSGYFVK